jgi:flagellar biosynthesis/type III secretory pathway ATPase
MIRDENLQTDTNSAINYDRMLSVVLESIQNDAQIKALNQMMNDLYKYSSPKYVMQTNGEINAVNSKEFDDAVEKIAEQIELRQQQIVSAYNRDFNGF